MRLFSPSTADDQSKKDDDYNNPSRRPRSAPNPAATWHHAAATAAAAAAAATASPAARLSLGRITARRLVVLVLAAVLVYVFVHNIPTDLGPQDRRRPDYNNIYHRGGLDTSLRDRFRRPGVGEQRGDGVRRGEGGGGGVPPRTGFPSEFDEADGGPDLRQQQQQQQQQQKEQLYDGPLKFTQLGNTLQAIAATAGGSTYNKNVLFTASSLQSAALMLPVACQMAGEFRNYVHFALMSTSEIAYEEVLKVNGIDKDDCHVIFHDARPDRAGSSTEERSVRALVKAMAHIRDYMHPQVVFLDVSGLEPAWFGEMMRAAVRKLELTLIELPDGGDGKLISWMTKLDTMALAAWHRVGVDIVVQAQKGASGGLIRLLKSLADADYTSLTVPRLTIELPEVVDPPTAEFLQRFEWPPRNVPNPGDVRQLTLRKHLPRPEMNEEESSVRFLESYWSSNPKDSHVLVLSTQVELAPNYLHYLLYTILEYRYSYYAYEQDWDRRLFSISLDSPTHQITGPEPFWPPPNSTSPNGDDPVAAYLWQAPNSKAALIPGNKWVELHSFVSQSLRAQRTADGPTPLMTEKVVSKRYPAWMELALRLCRAHGYYTLYPGPQWGGNLATVHDDLYQPPEEYAAQVSRKGSAVSEKEPQSKAARGSLDEAMPRNGRLVPFHNLPIVTWDNKLVSLVELDAVASEYAARFRSEVGRCTSTGWIAATPDASDLFCLGKEPI